MVAEHSRSVRTTWLYTLGSIVFFVGFYSAFVALFMLDAYTAAPGALVASVLVLQLVSGATQIRYCWFLRAGRGGGLPGGPAGVGWTIALVAPALAVWALGLFAEGMNFTAAASLWAACSLIACLLPRGARWLTLAAGLVAVVSHGFVAAAVSGDGMAPLPPGVVAVAVYAVVLPIMLLTSLWWWEIVVQLDGHRRTAAQLAVTQERLRFASDLHDIQGHHLQVISLKAELAERLMPIDPDAAGANIHEVRLIAKQALEETRKLVAGYRQVALDDELQNAREVLTAAGAQCDLRVGGFPSDPAVRSALASVVREATTNILRHSEATHVSIVLSTDAETGVLDIVNDGVVDGAGLDTSGGSGIAGLRERLTSVGGSLDSEVSDGRFELRARVPLAAAVHA